MISDTVIVGILAFLGTALTTFFANMKTTALIEYRLESLEKKVNLHNNVIERTYKLEEAEAVIEEKIKVCNNRISDLEKEVSK